MSIVPVKPRNGEGTSREERESYGARGPDYGTSRIKELTDAEIIEALGMFHGLHYLAASHLGVTAGKLKGRINRTPRLKQAMDQFRGELGDYAELHVAQGVLRGDKDYVKFYLTHKAKDRDYTAKTEVTGTVAVEHRPAVDLSGLGTDKLKQLADILTQAKAAEAMKTVTLTDDEYSEVDQ